MLVVFIWTFPKLHSLSTSTNFPYQSFVLETQFSFPIILSYQLGNMKPYMLSHIVLATKDLYTKYIYIKFK